MQTPLKEYLEQLIRDLHRLSLRYHDAIGSPYIIDGTTYSCPCCGYGHPEPTEEELERNGDREDAEMIRDCLAQGYAEGRRDAEIEDRERDL